MAEEIISKVNVSAGKGIPELLQYIAMDDVQVELRKLNKHFADEESEGLSGSEDLKGTDQLQEYELLHRAQSLSGINRGPGDIAIFINDPVIQPRWLAMNQMYKANFGRHKIGRVFYQCYPGATATFTVTFKW